jgi:hypothetical protein
MTVEAIAEFAGSDAVTSRPSGWTGWSPPKNAPSCVEGTRAPAAVFPHSAAATPVPRALSPGSFPRHRLVSPRSRVPVLNGVP